MRNEVSYGAISSVQKCDNVPVTYKQKNTMHCTISRNTFSAPRTVNYVQGINVVTRT